MTDETRTSRNGTFHHPPDELERLDYENFLYMKDRRVFFVELNDNKSGKRYTELDGALWGFPKQYQN